MVAKEGWILAGALGLLVLVAGRPAAAAGGESKPPRPPKAPGGGGDARFNLERYLPFAPETHELFREAARLEGLPLSWADSEGLHNILDMESSGWVGIPNGASGRQAEWPGIWAAAADGTYDPNPYGTEYIGLGQLGPGVRGGWTDQGCADGGRTPPCGSVRFLPNGAQSLGNPLEEARGMLGYIEDRYGDPDRAWAWYDLPIHQDCTPSSRSAGCTAYKDYLRANHSSRISGAIREGAKYHDGY